MEKGDFCLPQPEGLGAKLFWGLASRDEPATSTLPLTKARGLSLSVWNPGLSDNDLGGHSPASQMSAKVY